MRILDNYIGKAVAVTSLVVMLVLIALFSFANFITELDSVGTGDYGLREALLYVALTLPRLMYQLFPLVALLGSIIGLGMLANNSELMVIRAAGVSLARIVGSVMKVGLMMMVMAIVLGELVAPLSEQYAQNMRATAIEKRITLKTKNGLWVRDGYNFINIGEVLPDGRLGDIHIYEFDEQHRLQTATRAQRASYQGEHWVLERIHRSDIGANKITTQQLPSLAWESILNPQLVGVVAVKPETLAIWGLNQYINYLHENGLDAERYQLAFIRKIVAPLTTCVMVFLAIPFIFGPLRSVSVGQKILVGSLIGIGFYLFDQTLSYLGLVYGVTPLLSATLPTLLCLGLAAFLMRRVV